MGEVRFTRRDRARDEFHDRLVEDFVWGALGPGARIDVAGIRAMYGVDDDLARAELDWLVSAGMAQNDPTGELRIAPLTPQLSRILVARCRALSLQAVEGAVKHLHLIDVGALSALLGRMDLAAASEDRILLAGLVADFHDVVYVACGDDRLVAEIDAANPLMTRLMALVMQGNGRRMIQGLVPVAQAVENGDSELVSETYLAAWDALTTAVDRVPEMAWPN